MILKSNFQKIEILTKSYRYKIFSVQRCREEFPNLNFKKSKPEKF